MPGGIAMCSGRRKSLAMRSFILGLAAVILARQETCFATSGNSGPQLSFEDVSNRVSVYVYEDPVFDQAAVIQCYRDDNHGVAPWQDEREGKAQDAGEIWYHQAMLSHPWRVFDPEEADIFFIPLYPVLTAKVQITRKECDGLSHHARITGALMHLVKNSPYFNRFGGADHVVVCSWWNCGGAGFDPQHRMLLRRAVVGINEKLDSWSMWGCGSRMVTVPYTPNSAITTTSVVGGQGAEERTIPFFFEGTSRKRPERENLKVVAELSPDSVVDVGKNMHVWKDKAGSYAERISRSRFCFCPRGDTISSRRVYDAIAAGCIPVVTNEEFEGLPFMRTGLNYTEFVAVAPEGSFRTKEGVKAIVNDLSTRSNEELRPLQEALALGISSTIYGMSSGSTLDDMEPFHGTASRFLQAAKLLVEDVGVWNCPSSGLNEKKLSPRTQSVLPPAKHDTRNWLRESETIVNMEHSLLFCAPPNTGSLQFRMLAKRMQAVDHWSVPNVHSLLFDTVDSKLPLLTVTDKTLMEQIYKDNGSGWVKIGVVRDPVTRLLSAYLDLVHTWPKKATRSSSDYNVPHQPHRGLSIDDDWEKIDEIRRHRGLTGDEIKQQKKHSDAGEHPNPLTTEGDNYKGREEGESGHGSRTLQDAAAPNAPSFEEILKMLEVHDLAAPAALRPAANMCGMGLSPFDSIIPFETLQRTSTMVLKSLPGDIWRDFGESGWGPEGRHAFMEFDYGTVARQHPSADEDSRGFFSNEDGKWQQHDGEHRQTNSPPSGSPPARDLFSDGSCEWTKYYSSMEILETVGRLYAEDFDLFGWYDLDSWREKLEACLK